MEGHRIKVKIGTKASTQKWQHQPGILLTKYHKAGQGAAYISVAPLSFPGITYLSYEHTTQRTLILNHVFYSKPALAQELVRALINDKLTSQKVLRFIFVLLVPTTGMEEEIVITS